MVFRSPPITPELRTVIESYPDSAQNYAQYIRNLIYEVAASDTNIGQIKETLKWGEPAFLTSKPRSGTTLRFHWTEKKPNKIGLFVHCNTTLIRTFRDMFEDELELDGNRAIWLDLEATPPEDILKICIGRVLTYHLN